MDLSIFFEALDKSLTEQLTENHLGTHLAYFGTHFPNWQEADLVIIGSRECRAASSGTAMEGAADAARIHLYQLNLPDEQAQIADLGNLKPKDTPTAYYEMMAYVLNVLIQAEKTVIIIGGTQDIAFGQYLAFEEMERTVDYVHVDGHLDMEDSEFVLNQHSFNHKIFLHKPNYLDHFTNLGYQRFFADASQLAAIKALNFCALRYGDLHHQVREAEHHLREADMLSFDMSAIRHSDAPGASQPSPGGFSSLEACQIMRYAGLSYHINSLSICEWNPKEDIHEQTAMLAALMIWYFIEGYYSRKDDYPRKNRSNLRKYAVRLHASVEVINFYRHPHTERWWMEVPYPESIGKKRNRKTVLVACSEKDYEQAKKDEIPERWWMAFNKLG